MPIDLENPQLDGALNCSQCKFSLFQDTGYSNYTVEGTDFYCMKNIHPDDGFDSFYTVDVRLRYAEECPSFEKGEGIHMDVERENEENLKNTRD